MILHTVMPLELVLDGIDKPREFIDVEYDGARLTLEPVSFSQARIVRVFSTDPQVYMNPVLTPGSLISLLEMCPSGAKLSNLMGVDYSQP